MKITENYMEKVYAGWLGKIVGIRLGAPIEGWTYQRIRDVFGEVWSYPVDYKNFAAVFYSGTGRLRRFEQFLFQRRSKCVIKLCTV